MIRRGICSIAAMLLLGAQGALAGPGVPPLAPKVDLPDTPLSSPNVHLLATIPDTSSVGGRFLGKYFYTTVETAFVTNSVVSGLRVYDVSDPTLPVIAGFLPLPHSENEDVDVSAARKILLISQDVSPVGGVGGTLYVVDVMNPALPMIRSVTPYPAKASTPNGQSVGGPGHIANCILDCLYAYITGARDGNVYVYDLHDVTKPELIGTVSSPAGKGNAVFKTGIVHNVDVDPDGHIWFTGSGGTSEFAPIGSDDRNSVLHPQLLRSISVADDTKYDQFIHHNSLRLDTSTVLVTEEDWEQPQCGDTSNPINATVKQGEQGSFQTWHIGSGTGTGALTPLDTWETEMGDYLQTPGAGVALFCSSHWFTFNGNKVVAVGWYGQGVRFLNVSDPTNIRQVGYFVGPGTMASAGLFVPFRPDIVYVPDYQRGLDIIQIDNGGLGAPPIRAPVRSEWFAGYKGVAFLPHAKPDPTFGWGCARPAA